MEFWHLGAYKELNTCFIHFVNVGRLFGLIGDRELEPMMPLVDIWLEKGWLPRPASSAGSASGASLKKENAAVGDGRSESREERDRRDMPPPSSSHGAQGIGGGQSPA